MQVLGWPWICPVHSFVWMTAAQHYLHGVYNVACMPPRAVQANYVEFVIKTGTAPDHELLFLAGMGDWHIS